MKHLRKHIKYLNKNQRLGIAGFFLGTFGISPFMKDVAASELGMHNYLLFSLAIGCVCLVMIPLLADTFTSSKH